MSRHVTTMFPGWAHILKSQGQNEMAWLFWCIFCSITCLQHVLGSNQVFSIPPVTVHEKNVMSCNVATILHCTIQENKYFSVHKIAIHLPHIIACLPQHLSELFCLVCFHFLWFLSLTIIAPLRFHFHFTITNAATATVAIISQIPLPQPSHQNHTLQSKPAISFWIPVLSGALSRPIFASSIPFLQLECWAPLQAELQMRFWQIIPQTAGRPH